MGAMVVSVLFRLHVLAYHLCQSLVIMLQVCDCKPLSIHVLRIEGAPFTLHYVTFIWQTPVSKVKIQVPALTHLLNRAC